MTYKHNRGIICVVLLLGWVWGLAGCGVKAPPVPPKSIAPAAIVDLTAHLDQDIVTLNWSVPKGKAAGTAGVAGFIVYRAGVSLEDPAACTECPLLFRRIAEIDMEQYMAGASDRKKVTFRQSVDLGFRYVYKVVAMAKDGQRGLDSNPVTVRSQ
jgi:hypothetical protein